jgi:phosphoenolpyruvate-protein kinase (PTS system EI component)
MDGQTVPTTEPRLGEVRLSGRSIAPGLGMGRAWVIADELRADGIEEAIGTREFDRESDRLRKCFAETFAELDQSAKRIESEFDSALAGIFRAHGTILRGLVD